jgi:hypothetical protein
VLQAFPPRGGIRLLAAKDPASEPPAVERFVAEEYLLDTLEAEEGDRWGAGAGWLAGWRGRTCGRGGLVPGWGAGAWPGPWRQGHGAELWCRPG